MVHQGFDVCAKQKEGQWGSLWDAVVGGVLAGVQAVVGAELHDPV